MKHINVAIDGPSGAGKSTIARAAAKDLGLLYVDTGAIYRSIGYYLLRHGVDPKDKERVLPLLPGIRIALRYEEDGMQHMLLNGQDVTAEIRLPEVSAYASDVLLLRLLLAKSVTIVVTLGRSGETRSHQLLRALQFTYDQHSERQRQSCRRTSRHVHFGNPSGSCRWD